jgi:hypothetical protein
MRDLSKIDPSKIYEDMSTAADEYAHTAYVAELAEHAADHEFDLAMLRLRAEPGSLEMKRAEARSDPLVQKAYRALAEAKRAALRMKLEWQALTTKLEFVRTYETSLRAQAQFIDKAR